VNEDPGGILKGLMPEPLEEVPRVDRLLTVESRLVLCIERRRATIHYQPTSSNIMTKHGDEGVKD
jgi:hypothetical protein